MNSFVFKMPLRLNFLFVLLYVGSNIPYLVMSFIT